MFGDLILKINLLRNHYLNLLTA